MLANIINFGARRKAIAQQAVRDAAAGPSFTPDEYAEQFEAGRAEGYSEGLKLGQTAGLEEGRAKGFAEGVKDGAKAETARLKAILTSPEAKGRTEQARYFSFETEIAAELAVALLAKAPMPAPVAATSGLLAEMAAMQQPNIGASPATSASGDATMDKFESGAAAARAALGIK
jgi:hypothetical protein